MPGIFNQVCIVGAGAIGGWLGAGLARAGCAVSMVARGPTLAALQRDGLQLHSGAPEAVRKADTAPSHDPTNTVAPSSERDGDP